MSHYQVGYKTYSSVYNFDLTGSLSTIGTFTPNTDGWYKVFCQLVFSNYYASDTALRFCGAYLYKGASAIYSFYGGMPNCESGTQLQEFTDVSFPAVVYLTTSDTLYLKANTSAEGACFMDVLSGGNQFWNIMKLSDP